MNQNCIIRQQMCPCGNRGREPLGFNTQEEHHQQTVRSEFYPLLSNDENTPGLLWCWYYGGSPGKVQKIKPKTLGLGCSF